MHTKPTPVRLSRQHDRSATRAIEGHAVLIETGAGPRRDRNRYHAIWRSHDQCPCQIEAELRRARPDIVPLQLGPCRQAFYQLLVGAEDCNVGVPERTRRRVVYVPHARGEAVKPVAHFGRRSGIGFRQGQVHTQLLLSSLSTSAQSRLSRSCPFRTGSIPLGCVPAITKALHQIDTKENPITLHHRYPSYVFNPGKVFCQFLKVWSLKVYRQRIETYRVDLWCPVIEASSASSHQVPRENFLRAISVERESGSQIMRVHTKDKNFSAGFGFKICRLPFDDLT